MSNKLLLGTIVLIIIFAGASFFVTGKKETPTTPTPIPIQQNSSSQVIPTSPPVAQSSSPTQILPNQVLQGEVSITLTTTGFLPQKIIIKKGTRVIFVNQSGISATVNSDSHPTHIKYSELNLGQFDNGSSLQLVFDKAGTYSYHNHLAPSMTGTITVQ